MSATNISTNPDVRIIHGETTTLLAFPDRLVFACSECGHTKHVQYLAPAKDIHHFDASDYCVCGQAMSNRRMLEEVYAGMGTCKTLEEARLFVLSLKSTAS